MVIEIKSKEDIKSVKELLAKREPEKKFDARKFCGAIKFDEDALAIQQKLRNEWD